MAAPAACAEEIRVDLDRPDDPHVIARASPEGFALDVVVERYLQKLAPTTIRIRTRQQGSWRKPEVRAGRYLKTQFDPHDPSEVQIESTLDVDLEAGERRFQQEREAAQLEARRRAGSKGEGAVTGALMQLLRERIAAIREENVAAGADPRGGATRGAPPLPRRALAFEKVPSLEKILKEQCYWQSVAAVFRATGFALPSDSGKPAFSASLKLATEVHQAVHGINVTPQFLTEAQYRALREGHGYEFSATFVPELPGAGVDLLWRTAPAVRLADGLIRQARLEGGLDRRRGRTVEWWRVECDTPARIQAEMIRGDGDCFWRWVDGPRIGVRYLRVLLHSPGTRYRLKLTLAGAREGAEVTVYDGPIDAPTKGPF